MSWKIHEARNFLIPNGIHPTNGGFKTAGYCLFSDYVSVTNDPLETNVITYNIYGENEIDALLLELSLSKSQEEFREQAENKFFEILSTLTRKSIRSEIPDDLSIRKPGSYEIHGYVIKILNDSVKIPGTVKAILMKADEKELAEKTRSLLLSNGYSETIK